MSNEIDTKILHLKEEVLKAMHESDNKNMEIFFNLQKKLEEKFTYIDVKLEENKLKFDSLQDKDANFKIKIIENFPLLENSVKNNSEDIFLQKICLNSFEKQLRDAINKYDKIVLENLIVPGTIGEYCQFKNLKEYIEVFKLNLL